MRAGSAAAGDSGCSSVAAVAAAAAECVGAAADVWASVPKRTMTTSHCGTGYLEMWCWRLCCCHWSEEPLLSWPCVWATRRTCTAAVAPCGSACEPVCVPGMATPGMSWTPVLTAWGSGRVCLCDLRKASARAGGPPPCGRCCWRPLRSLGPVPPVPLATRPIATLCARPGAPDAAACWPSGSSS